MRTGDQARRGGQLHDSQIDEEDDEDEEEDEQRQQRSKEKKVIEDEDEGDKDEEQEDPPQPEKQVKERKLAVPRKTKLHIPHDIIPPKRNEPIPGLPADGGKVLIGYEESWAKKIYETPNHRTAIRNLRHQRAAAWDLNNEVVEVQAIVQKSGLWKAIKY